MLVLSRKEGARIVIDDQITISVAQIRGSVVRLAIEAPKDVPIYRSEIQERIVRQRRFGNKPCAA